MILIRLLVCIALFVTVLYLYLDEHHRITRLRYELPALAEELTAVRERNASLHYEIDRFESPLNLMHLLSLPEYSHLKHPELSEIIWIPLDRQGVAAHDGTRGEEATGCQKPI